MLRGVIALAVIVRLVVWSVRLASARRTLARGMLAGYAHVLRALPSY